MDDYLTLSALEAAFRECECDDRRCGHWQALRKAERKIAKRLQRKGGE